MLRSFRLHQPSCVADASRLLKTLGDEARVYAGGTELLFAMKEGLIRCGHLIDIKNVGLDRITFDTERRALRIGATVTHRVVEHSELVLEYAPLLASMERHLGNVRVRAVGTVGGNLCFAEPRSDLATVLLVYDATVVIGNARDQRRVRVGDLILDSYTTCLAPDELLLEIEVPPLPPGAGAAYQKVAFLERPSASVCTAIIPSPDSTSVKEARIAVGAINAKPIRVFSAEQALTGAPLEGRMFDLALNSAVDAVKQACTPLADHCASPEYKRHLAGVLTLRTVKSARDRVLTKGEGSNVKP